MKPLAIISWGLGIISAEVIRAMLATDEKELVLLLQEEWSRQPEDGAEREVPVVRAQSELPRACLRAPGIHTQSLPKHICKAAPSHALRQSDQPVGNELNTETPLSLSWKPVGQTLQLAFQKTM